MPKRDVLPVMDEYYHVYNRGVEKRVICNDARDYQRFLNIVRYYLNPEPPISYSQKDRIAVQLQHRELELSDMLVNVIAYCLMPNHFHFLVRVKADQGLETWIRRSIDSYTRSFNTRWSRVGPLFQGPYKFEHIGSDRVLLHISRYIHLNPVVSNLVHLPDDWRWSSMAAYIDNKYNYWIDPSIILDQMDSENYRKFVIDHVGYATSIEKFKHSLIDEKD